MATFQKIKLFLFENQTTRQTVAKNTLWLFSGEIISKLLKVIFIIYSARMLGLAGWGIFSYVISLATTIFVLFSDIGLSTLLIREAAVDREGENYLSTIFIIKIFLLIISAAAIIMIAPIITKIKIAKSLLLIIALLLISDALKDFIFNLTRAIEKMEYEAFIKILTNVLLVTLGLIIMIINPSVNNLAISYLLSSVMGLLAASFILKHYFRKIVYNFDKNLIWPILITAYPFIFFAAYNGIISNIDIVILGWFNSTQDIGIYSAVQRPVQIFYIIPAFLTTALFPALIKTFDDAFRKILEKSMIFILLICLPAAIIGIILSKEIILFSLGYEYLRSIKILQILILSVFFAPINTLLLTAVFSKGKQGGVKMPLIIGTISGILLNLILIPYTGIYGAATSIVMSQFLMTILIWKYLKNINYFSILKYLPSLLIISILTTLTTVALKFIGINFLINIFISIPVYLLITYNLFKKEIREFASRDRLFS